MNNENKNLTTANPITAGSPAATANPGGFLIVDDMSINIIVTHEMLMPYGLPVDDVESGAEAIGVVEKGNVYDIIFMDHMMPEMNGIEATKIIRGKGYTGCIVMLTANVSEENDKLYAEGIFDRVISKPIDAAQMDEVVREFIFAEKLPSAHDNAEACDTSVSHDPLEVAKWFLLDAKDAIEVLEEMFAPPIEITDEDMDTYEVTVHGLKSAFKNIEEHEMCEFARKMEKAAVAGDVETMKNETPLFLSQLKRIVSELSQGE